jgi:hypothetical protein
LLHAFTGLAALFGETVATLSVWSATLLNRSVALSFRFEIWFDA